MEKLTFTNVTEQNRDDFHCLMRMYARELDKQQNKNTDSEMLKKWTDRIIEKQFQPNMCLRLCFCQSETIGFIFGKIDLPNEKGYKEVGYGNIMEFYVLPNYRRNGYGGQMYRFLESFFISCGVDQLYLTANPVTGKPFWEKLGFIRTGELSPINNQEIYEKTISETLDKSV